MLDTDPELALKHAYAARASGARVGYVREAVGLAAYQCGEWAVALSELRTYRRLVGGFEHFPVEVDCERALGRVEKVAKALDAPEARELDAAGRIELLLVVAGSRRDAGDIAGSLALLERAQLRPNRPASWSLRLWYVYADTLLAADRVEEAAEWFSRVVEHDDEESTDAAERLLELSGVEDLSEEDEVAEFEMDEPAKPESESEADKPVEADEPVAADETVGEDETVEEDETTESVASEPAEEQGVVSLFSDVEQPPAAQSTEGQPPVAKPFTES